MHTSMKVYFRLWTKKKKKKDVLKLFWPVIYGKKKKKDSWRQLNIKSNLLDVLLFGNQGEIPTLPTTTTRRPHNSWRSWYIGIMQNAVVSVGSRILSGRIPVDIHFKPNKMLSRKVKRKRDNRDLVTQFRN